MFNRTELNDIYFPLCEKAENIKTRLQDEGLDANIGWYNNHAHDNGDGSYEPDCFPIPVVEAKGLLDVEIDFEGISVTSKLSRQSALDFEYDLLEGFHFEIYGAEDYLGKLYHPERGIIDLLNSISASFESEIVFGFDLGSKWTDSKLLKLVEILKENGFYY